MVFPAYYCEPNSVAGIEIGYDSLIEFVKIPCEDIAIKKALCRLVADSLSKCGEGYFDIVIVVLIVVMVIALIMAVAPVVSEKIQLDNYADEIVREAEISGRIGSETTAMSQVLTERTGIALKIE